jgi:hypothetical protein
MKLTSLLDTKGDIKMGFIKDFFASKVNSVFESEAASVVRVCQSYGPTERTELKVCMLLALATLVTESKKTGDESIFKILEAMDSCDPISSAELGMLSTYTMKLITAQKLAYGSNNHITNLMAAGIPIWIVSIRALSHVSVLPYARQLWGILQDSDGLTVYDSVSAIANRLGTQPIVAVLLRIRSSFSTPKIFNPF